MLCILFSRENIFDESLYDKSGIFENLGETEFDDLVDLAEESLEGDDLTGTSS